MTPIDLPDAARETGVVGLGCQEADKNPNRQSDRFLI
jgi:hypothetical protein